MVLGYTAMEKLSLLRDKLSPSMDKLLLTKWLLLGNAVEPSAPKVQTLSVNAPFKSPV